MKALIFEKYGSPDDLELREVAMPALRPDEVLVKVVATAVNAADGHLLKGEPFPVRLETGLLRPKNGILGSDVAGRVVAVGKNVKEFQPGDEVFGDLSGHGRGGFASHVAAPASAWVHKPARVSFQQAAAVPMAATTALQGLRKHGSIQAGQKVLINGASGGVGTFAVQIAKALGAEVTAVCSTRKLEMVRAIGADHAIDYTQEDFTTNGQRYDLIFDTVANHTVADYQRALAPKGTYVSCAVLPALLLMGPWLSMTKGLKMVNMLAKPNKVDLLFLADLLDNGKINPVIDRCYPLSQAAEALRYLGQGHARGKVIILVED